MSSKTLTLYPSPHVLKLLALHHRLPTHHERYQLIQKKVNNELAGFHGEKRMLYPLSKFQSYCKILPNIRLNLHTHHFQMDFLIISPKFILILESKYYSDDLLFDDTVHQVIQQKGQETKVYDDPVLQVEEQAYQLSNWLDRFNLSNLPIEHYVVMTNSNTRLQIESTNTHHAQRVISLQRLPSLFRELMGKHENSLSVKEINLLADQISQNHKPYIPDILQVNKIVRSEIDSGVFCMNCGSLGMRMIRRRWQCTECGCREKLAHEHALKDYYLLFGGEITNREFRSFTGLESGSTAKDMLIRSTDNRSGEKYRRKYYLNYNYRSVDFNYLIQLNKQIRSRALVRS